MNFLRSSQLSTLTRASILLWVVDIMGDPFLFSRQEFSDAPWVHFVAQGDLIKIN
jgi:hypothetical protein